MDKESWYAGGRREAMKVIVDDEGLIHLVTSGGDYCFPAEHVDELIRILIEAKEMAGVKPNARA